jgi:hypothetical protein
MNNPMQQAIAHFQWAAVGFFVRRLICTGLIGTDFSRLLDSGCGLHGVMA